MKISQTEKRMFGQFSIAGSILTAAWIMAIVADPFVKSSHPFVKMLFGVVILCVGFAGFTMWLHTVKNEFLPYLKKECTSLIRKFSER
jgi:uncharacterized membrane protein YcaP (DUF421 family)